MSRGVGNWQITFQQIQDYLWIVKWNTFFLAIWLDLLFLGRGSNEKERQNVLIIYKSCLIKTLLSLIVYPNQYIRFLFRAILSDSWNNSTRKDGYIQMDCLTTVHQWDFNLACLKCFSAFFWDSWLLICDNRVVYLEQ